MMNPPLQFHPIHGEHIKLSKNNTTAKRVDSFCKGICFSNRTIGIREKVYVRLLTKSVQWTGFLRLGMTTCDPDTHRTSASLPRHACPDLTCRPGFWAKCVPENCFDLTNKLTYFYVDEHGELFLNTLNGEISLLTGISVREPLWALLDIYGNCISIELVDSIFSRVSANNDLARTTYTTVMLNYYRDLQSDLQPVTFLPVHTPSISLLPASSTSPLDRSIVSFDRSKQKESLVFFSEPLTTNSGVLMKILQGLNSNDPRQRPTPNASASPSNTLSSPHLQLGLINCDITSLAQANQLPLTIEQINHRSEFWIIHDFPLANKANIEQGDEFLFVLNGNGVIEYSHNQSKFADFIHIDSTLTYYPFLIFNGDVISVRSMGYLRNLDKCRFLHQEDSTQNDLDSSRQGSTKTNNNSTTDDLVSQPNQECTVCLDRRRDTVLIPCGHICLCYPCAKGLFEYGSKQCPICRSTITLVNKFYLA